MNTTLICNHTLDMPIIPKIGERLWCKFCQVFREVECIEAWKINCRQCQYGRRTQTVDMAFTIASLHANRRGHHLKIEQIKKNPRAHMVHPDTSVLF